MRIIFFNIWHGMVINKLSQFIQKYAVSTDIYAFVEMDSLVKSKLDPILTDFASFYFEGIKTNYLGGVKEGRIIYFKKNIKIENTKIVSLYQETPVMLEEC